MLTPKTSKVYLPTPTKQFRVMSKEVRKNLSKEHIDDMLKTFTNQ